jgi:phenylacetate-CoA ligase
VLEAEPAFAGEFICVATRDAAGRDELTVRVEVKGDTANAPLADRFAALLKQHFGVQMNVTLEPAGGLASLTGIETRQKPIRLLDQRF